MEKKSTNITVKIKYGKQMPDATFELEGSAEMNVYDSQGRLICLSMSIGSDKIDRDSMDEYFYNSINYKNIEDALDEKIGEIA